MQRSRKRKINHEARANHARAYFIGNISDDDCTIEDVTCNHAESDRTVGTRSNNQTDDDRTIGNRFSNQMDVDRTSGNRSSNGNGIKIEQSTQMPSGSENKSGMSGFIWEINIKFTKL